jgi:Bax protein
MSHQKQPARTAPKETLSVSFWDDEVPLIHPESPESLLRHLKAYGLWEIDEDAEIQPVVFANFPPQLKDVTAETKKRMFLHSLLPVVSVALAEVKQERHRLEAILMRSAPENQEEGDFFMGSQEWRDRLTPEESDFLENLSRKYRTADPAELLDRVNEVPVSLILAQGAIESYWGTSRFAREANNLFGMWTWGEKGIIPAKRDAGKTHKIAIYDSILESVRNFILTLNRLPAYDDFRRLRRGTMDSLVLVDGLFCYSERGQGYIDDVKQVIDHNELRKYDGLLLKEPDQPESLGRIASPGKLTAAGAAVFNEKDQVLNNRTS